MKNDEQKRQSLIKHWNKKVACDMPTKKEIRRNKRKLRATKRIVVQNFHDYMNVIESTNVS